MLVQRNVSIFLLHEFRQIVSTDLHENWDQLSREHQIHASTMLNFFCGLHSLAHCAELANKCLIQVDCGFFDGKAPIFDALFRKSSESVAFRLVRVAPKALARGADERSGKFKG